MADVNDLIETAWPKAHLVDNSILLPAMMCLAASRNGNRVILHGVSGDLTTHVPDRYASYLMSNGAWRLAWHECRGASRNHTFLRNSSPLLIWLQNVWAAYTPEKLKNLVGRLRGQRSHSSRSVINSSFARKLNLKDRLRDQASSQARPSFRSIRNDHAALLNSPTFGVELGLTGYEHMAGRFGVELRDPWSDKRVIEFFLHLPLSYKIRKGWTKYLVRAAFVSELDAVVASRMSKEHLGWRFADRLMAETRDFVSRTLEKDLEVIENYVDPKAVLARYRHYLATENDVDREFFYDLMTLILWLKRISK
jgi:asparagine synthase (glutamine-hydrolysing)